MSQIKIYGLNETLKSCQSQLSDAIHKAVVQALAYPLGKRFHRFIGLEPSQFIFPADRSANYTIIEISAYSSPA